MTKIAEPPDSMYPSDTEHLYYTRCTAIWQIKHVEGVQFFILAFGPEDAYKKAVEILTEMGRDIHKGKFQYRRLPVVAIRR